MSAVGVLIGHLMIGASLSMAQCAESATLAEA